MRSVTLLKHFSTMEAMQKLSNFYQSEETTTASPIQVIRFLDWNVDVSRTLCTPIEAILKNVESLTFEDTSINTDLDGCLFPLMPNLKRLTILSVAKRLPPPVISVNSIWRQPPCPSLEYFAWHKELSHFYGLTPKPPTDEFPANEIARFLAINSGIKFVSLRLDSIEQLKQLTANGVQVNELFFAIVFFHGIHGIHGNKTKLADIVNGLKVFCEKQNSMKMANNDQRIRLHLQTNGFGFDEEPDQLELLAPYIVGMYFTGFIPKCFAAVFPKLIHLKAVQMLEDVHVNLLCTLPNLQEVFIVCKSRPLSYYYEEIRILGSQLPKLKKMHLNRYLHQSLRSTGCGDLMEELMIVEEDNFEIFEKIDAERKKLAGAQKLKVYLEVSQSLTKKKVDYDMVQVIRSQTEAITNPFFKHTHTSCRCCSCTRFRKRSLCDPVIQLPKGILFHASFWPLKILFKYFNRKYFHS